MADKAHNETDKILAEMEQHLSAIYEEASADIEAKAQEYFDRFKAQDEEMRKKVKSGEITEAEYIEWRRKKMLYGKRYADMQRSLAEEISHVNETAMAYINDKLPTIYALNFNALKGAVESVVKGYSFSLVNPQVVKNLATRDKTLLPYKYVNGRKDVRWNTQKVNSAVLQGVLQGESVSDIGKRLQSVTEMNRTSAIRNARTTVTSAECKGRQDSYEQAAKDGIEIEREWIATNDYRTRHSHVMLDGQIAPVNKPFKSELGPIMYPGDPNAHPSNVYQCRCTIAEASINGINIQDGMKYSDRHTVRDVYEKDPKEFDIRQKMAYNEKADKKQYELYKTHIKPEMPKTFREWQDIKYRNTERYEYLKGYNRYKTYNPKSGKEYYEANRAVISMRNQKKIRATGTVVTPPKSISFFVANEHAMDSYARKNITKNDAWEIVRNSDFALKQRKGDQHTFYSKKGYVTITKDGIMTSLGWLDDGGKLLYNEVMKYVEN